MATSIKKARSTGVTQEALLELVQLEGGEIVLRPVNSTEEPLVSIRFAQQVQDAMGEQLPLVGQQMIQAAVHAYIEQQAARWHANVVDEEPTHYS